MSSNFPSHWQTLPFEIAVADVTAGKTKLQGSEYSQSGVLPIIDQGQEFIGGYTDDVNNQANVTLPTIIFGDHTRVFKYVDFPFCLGADGTKILEPKVNLDKRFLFHYLKSLNISSAGYSRHYKFLKENVVPVPPLVEQKRIAAILDKADAIRRKRQNAIKLADEFLRAVFLDMFGDPVTNPKGWEVNKLKDLVSKIGSGSTPTGGKESYLSEGISLIRSLNIHDNQFRYKDLAFISDQQAKKLANVIIEKNDVLLNITGASVCRCAIVPENVLPARVNQHVAIIRTKNMNPIYLMHLLISKSYKHKLLLLSGSGATREALTKEQIENLEVPCPPYDLQDRFQEIESKVSEFTNRLDIFAGDELFNSLSQKAFSE